MPNKITIKIEQLTEPSPKSGKASGLYLMELRSRRASERESRQKLSGSSFASSFKEPFPSGEKKVRS